MMEKSCDTCAHKTAETRDEADNRMVECELNDMQMYFPFALECKHWEKAPSKDDEA